VHHDEHRAALLCGNGAQRQQGTAPPGGAALPTMPILLSPASPAWAWAAGFAALPRASTPTGP